ncbi:MAG: Gfo/Idh/MocA family oxidoreductase [Candidatus Rokubacteria bacterium]|nr:Gfo/Idh/MocA family oxidoreductase [Candidatus Rokubacteria bacterium]
MNVLLVGLGRWGEKHRRVLAELGVTVWAADVSAERRAWAAKNGVDPSRVVADVAAALGRVDAVDIVTPADTHLEIASRCLSAGKDCFVEKPLAQTVAEARRLTDVVAETGRILQVGHIFRFHPVTDALCRCLVEGRVGRVRYLTARFAGFKRPRTDVGVTQTDAIHYFDLFAYLLGRAPTAVTALLRDYLGRGLDDLAFVTVEYGEVPAIVEAGYFVPGTHRDCLIVGERGSLVADFGRSVVTVFGHQHQRAGGQWTAREGEQEELKATGEEPLRRELEAFLEAVATRRRPAVDVEAGLLALRVVEAAQLSSRLGRRVSLDEV